jgi:hypothetical protein
MARYRRRQQVVTTLDAGDQQGTVVWKYMTQNTFRPA